MVFDGKGKAFYVNSASDNPYFALLPTLRYVFCRKGGKICIFGKIFGNLNKALDDDSLYFCTVKQNIQNHESQTSSYRGLFPVFGHKL